MPVPASPQPVVIVVAHGSRNPRWVAAQRAWFAGVEERLSPRGIRARLCFLELTAPSLEEELAALDGREPKLHVFPFFLSKSGHVSEDIPEVAEAALRSSTMELIEPEGRAAVLGANAARRLRAAGADPALPVVVSGYGASAGDGEWLALVESVRAHAAEYAATPWLWAPAGHFLADYSAPLRAALASVVAGGHAGAAVLPLYLAVSSYQEELIPGVVAEFPALRIAWQPTAILPDPAIEQWGADLIAASLTRQGTTHVA